MEYDGEIAGQLNIWGIARGSLSSATIGYWVSGEAPREAASIPPHDALQN